MSNDKESPGCRWIIILMNGAALAFVLTVLKLLANLVLDNRLDWDDPSSSPDWAKFNGIYVCPVQANPESIDWNGTKISFDQMWIEHQVHTTHPLIWTWHVEKSGRDLLCFTLKSGQGVFHQTPRPFFRGSAFLHAGSVADRIGQDEDQRLFYAEMTPESEAIHGTDLKLVSDPTEREWPQTQLSW